MNKILKQITKNCYNSDLSQYFEKRGNYKVIRSKKYIRHYYYDNLICEVDIYNMTFKFDFCGYFGYRLTTAQINYLREFYSERNYKEL